MSIRRASVVLVTLMSLAAAAAPAAAPDPSRSCADIPWNIRVEPNLRPIVVSLLEKSDTFRRQCRIIAATRKVRLAIAMTREPQRALSPRARARITRYSYGLIRVAIELPPLADHAELLPHEFEHVLEQIEGVDLPALADRGQGEVVQVVDGMYETTRAKHAGRAAAREVHGETDPAVTATFRGLGRALRAVSATAPAAAGPPSRR